MAGVDLGVKTLATVVTLTEHADGTTAETVEAVPNPKPLGRWQRKLARQARQMARRQPGSRRRARTAASLARTHHKVANARRDSLHKLTSRLAHSGAVARQAKIVQPALSRPWNIALVSAAWLHDVGYAPDLCNTGFHPLDGARWLRTQGWSSEVCRLVAWHTRAEAEAWLLGLLPELESEFPRPPDEARAALAWADLTSSPTGKRCTATDRISGILKRYPEDSVVHRATLANRSQLEDDVAWVKEKLGAP